MILALALPAETLAEGLSIEYDAAPTQVESAVYEADDSVQAVPDGETGEAEDEAVSAADIDAAVPEAGELSLGDDEESSALAENIPEPGESLPSSTGRGRGHLLLHRG